MPDKNNDNIAREVAERLTKLLVEDYQLTIDSLPNFQHHAEEEIISALRRFEPLPCGHARSGALLWNQVIPIPGAPTDVIECRACERARAEAAALVAAAYQRCIETVRSGRTINNFSHVPEIVRALEWVIMDLKALEPADAQAALNDHDECVQADHELYLRSIGWKDADETIALLAKARADRDMDWWKSIVLNDGVAPTPEAARDYLAREQQYHVAKAREEQDADFRCLLDADKDETLDYALNRLKERAREEAREPLEWIRERWPGIHSQALAAIRARGGRR